MPDSFVYIWTHLHTGRMYIGVHKGTPDDGYVSSGKLFLEHYKREPDQFRRVIVAYGDYDVMLRVEKNLLERVDAARNPMFFNKTNGTLGTFYNKEHTEDVKRRIATKNSIALRGRQHSPEHKAAHSRTKQRTFLGEGNPFYGKRHTDETKRRQREAKIGRYEGANNPNYGRKHSEETREKIRQKALARSNKKVTYADAS